MNELQRGFFSEHPIFILNHRTLDIIDANYCAIEKYKYSHDELCEMNIYDLGLKKKRTDLIQSLNGNGDTADKIWIHKTKEGREFYAQFTTHTFNYKNKRVKFAVVHDVSMQVEVQEQNPNKFPQVLHENGKNTLAEIVWEADKTVRKWSEKAEQLFGWREDEVVGKSDFFDRFIHEDELEEAYKVIDHATKNLQASYQVDGRVTNKKGEVRVCEWNNSIEYNEHDEVVAIHSLVQDITDRKNSEILFKALSEESRVGIYLIQNDVFKYVNPRFCKIFDYAKDEIENKLGPLDLAHPNDQPLIKENIRKRLEKEVESIQHDFKGLTKDQKKIHIEAFGKRIEYLGKPAIIGTLLDVTQSKMALRRYQASVESFENLFDSISDAIYILDNERRFIKVNDAAEKLSGYKRNELIGRTPDMLTAPGKTNLDKTHQYFQNALEGASRDFKRWGLHKNGEIFPEKITLNPGHYFGEKVVIAIARDISHQVEVQEQMEQSEERFWQLFQNAPLGIALMDKNQSIRIVNPGFEQLFGYSSEEIEGRDIDRLVVPSEHYEKGREISKSIFKGQTSSVTTKRKRKDGSLIDVLVYGLPVELDGEIIAIFGIYVDISERSEYEKKIKKSLKEKEVMLAEIHHRVKNNLAVITGLLELQQYNTELESAKNILRESQLRINSIALIHEKLYQSEDLSEISIEVYLQELVEVITHSMQSTTTDVSIDIQAKATFLTINQAIPCGLILNELITNTYKHAFPDRETGEILIEINSDSETFHLTYKDNGTGIPEDVDFDNPSSLGVTLIQTLAKQLNGTYAFENTQEGVCYTLQFELE